MENITLKIKHGEINLLEEILDFRVDEYLKSEAILDTGKSKSCSSYNLL